ncbi:MAG: S9 family peptidase [Candidatus Korarchaeota archaeon]|nr:S9 family peptidase [Candidatus Korarchaeota archaeon]NIU85306.1 prolyl oligopeptidase family serine peptidase [Candidatus Thorarchaeota archaeon]NIW15406.1 prolyl oligopeptidase family serine peptidase [Candidatus Thorarchaeota archaeon]NIW53350.1 prolyl oligopeptidase family serine peptidase [Candidatus Korarchaeota archaeon]
MYYFFSNVYEMDKDNGNSEKLDELLEWTEKTKHYFNAISRAIDDVLWYEKLGDIAEIDKVYILGPPVKDNYPESLLTSPQERDNHVRFPAYIFVPKRLDQSQQYPLLVFPHGGVHSNFSTFYAHIVRELLQQGYLIIAPEYRGSTGYGERFYKKIDYGGLEVEDTYAARNWMVENHPLVDPDRVGILGWSHGGLHALLNVFNHPKAYNVAYACVPVSDLVARMGYMTQDYRDLYSADYHIGETAHENVKEYMQRSPAWNAEKLRTPLLIHTTTNDEDVNVLEVKHLIKALKAAEKEFEYKIYEDAPGGHVFNRLDTKFARKSRQEVYQFLADYLSPPKRWKPTYPTE